MTIDQILYEHIKTNLVLVGSFEYGSGEGLTAPYVIMTKIADPERPEVLCEDQGDAGRAVFQFSGYLGGNNAAAANAANTVIYLDELKEQVNLIKGEIGTTDKVLVNNNITGGV
ncbi:MAG: hypothetical protein GY782_08840, partial [Gammaproteobacteria bacterium]|nr:hypothetical protein [Gammaproteobacteria bacterium]